MPIQARIPSVREIIDRSSRAPLALSYPRNVPTYRHKMVMIFNKYDLPGNYRQRVNEQNREAVLTPTAAITMPVPIKIYEPYSIQINSENLGVFGAGVANFLSADTVLRAPTLSEALIRGAAGTAGMGAGAAAEVGRNILGSLPGGGILSRLGSRGLNAAGTTLGVAINPYTTARFKGVPLRGFEFKWKVSPESKEETDQIEGIIDAIRLRMHPEPLALSVLGADISNVILKYPELLTFKILGSEYSESIPTAPCYVQSFTVDRSGADYPSFYADTGAPVVYFIQMNVIELLPLLRKDNKLEMNNPLYNASTNS